MEYSLKTSSGKICVLYVKKNEHMKRVPIIQGRVLPIYSR